MSRRIAPLLLLLAGAAGCGRRADPPRRDTAATGGPATDRVGGCRVLTATDIREITGAAVHLIGRGASPGAGGTCGNYATPDDDAYLGVNALESAADYTTAVSAVPEDVYPKRQAIPGLGDQAILMKDETGMLRYLVARKGNRGVVLFPLGHAGRAVSDAQLRELAERALAAR
jgi:hypothetical protein